MPCVNRLHDDYKPENVCLFGHPISLLAIHTCGNHYGLSTCILVEQTQAATGIAVIVASVQQSSLTLNFVLVQYFLQSLQSL